MPRYILTELTRTIVVRVIHEAPQDSDKTLIISIFSRIYIYIYLYGSLSVSLCLCLSVCLSLSLRNLWPTCRNFMYSHLRCYRTLKGIIITSTDYSRYTPFHMPSPCLYIPSHTLWNASISAYPDKQRCFWTHGKQSWRVRQSGCNKHEMPGDLGQIVWLQRAMSKDWC